MRLPALPCKLPDAARAARPPRRHRAAPEAIARAQLAALQQGDVFNAASFSSWRGGLKGHLASRRTGAPAGWAAAGRRCQPPAAALTAQRAWHCPNRSLLTARRPAPTHAGLAFHHEALRQKLRQEPYGLLLRHAAAQLGTAALPSQRELLQEVGVLAADGSSARFLWRLGIGQQGCWMVTGIFSEPDLQAADWQKQPHI